VCVCVRACVRACVRGCVGVVTVCVWLLFVYALYSICTCLSGK